MKIIIQIIANIYISVNQLKFYVTFTWPFGINRNGTLNKLSSSHTSVFEMTLVKY